MPKRVDIGGKITFGPLTQATMGNSERAEVVPENDQRRTLILCNSSDTTGYFRFANGALNFSNYLFRLLAGQTITFNPPICQQSVYAVCGAASKKVSYQEAEE
ncbi:MAG: hypothetical protein JXA14_26050 [Anaerolineae bacterium]|nr:hypothetical protein [Anaerolineae bacterium]